MKDSVASLSLITTKWGLKHACKTIKDVFATLHIIDNQMASMVIRGSQLERWISPGRVLAPCFHFQSTSLTTIKWCFRWFCCNFRQVRKCKIGLSSSKSVKNVYYDHQTGSPRTMPMHPCASHPEVECGSLFKLRIWRKKSWTSIGNIVDHRCSCSR